MAETWRPVPGYSDHEVSSLGRVRTTAVGTSSTSATSWAWLLLLVLAVVAVRYAHVVNTIATAVTVGVCAVPVGWLCWQLLAEVVLSAECRGYRTPVPRRARAVQPRALPRAPLAIEAARVTPLVIDVQTERMER